MNKFILLHRACDNKLIIVNVDNIGSVIPNEEEEGIASIYNLNGEFIETVTENVAEIYKKLERFM
jgi:hypothetical protein